MKPATRAPGQRPLRLERSGPWIAAVGLLMVLWLVVMAAILFAPWWGTVAHVAVLSLFTATLARQAAQRPARTIWLPVGALAAWAAVNAVGVLAFDWRL